MLQPAKDTLEDDDDDSWMRSPRQEDQVGTKTYQRRQEFNKKRSKSEMPHNMISDSIRELNKEDCSDSRQDENSARDIIYGGHDVEFQSIQASDSTGVRQ